MTSFVALLLSFLTTLNALAPATTVYAADALVSVTVPLMINDFHLHTFDKDIASALGYDNVSVVYMSEMASVSADESLMRDKYEAIGCYPFYVLKDGTVQEAGYNCGTFFCTGYSHGPKQCRDRTGASYGGVMEINRRLGLVTLQDDKISFDAYPADQLTPAMRSRMDALKDTQCRPFYLQRFDLIVGEGYTCNEIGRYPYFSGANTCINDWRNSNGLTCDTSYRPNEMDFRKEITARARTTSSSFSSISSSSSKPILVSATSQTGASVLPSPTFPDVMEGKYGYTAIMALTKAGILKGYADGTFQPQQSINRAEFASLILRRYAMVAPPGGHCFKDVLDQWYAPAVCAAKDLGWISGYPDRRFKPNAPINRAEALKIVTSSLYLPPLYDDSTLPPDVPADAWYAPLVRTAIQNHLILEPVFLPSANATRADVAVWLYRSMRVSPIGSGSTL